MLSKNPSKILFLPPYLNFLLFELNGKTFISFSLLCTCLFACAVDDGVNEGEPIEKFAEQYREPEPENHTASRSSRKALKTASPIPSFDCIFNPVFQTQPIGLFYKIAYDLLLKPLWIATP